MTHISWHAFLSAFSARLKWLDAAPFSVEISSAGSSLRQLIDILPNDFCASHSRLEVPDDEFCDAMGAVDRPRAPLEHCHRHLNISQGINARPYGALWHEPMR